jgi:hypothetical protein
MPPIAYPGGLPELEFVDAYHQSTLRKPQVAADAALRALVTAGHNQRALLTGLIGEQLAEACRRLVAVYSALADRRHPVARSLMAPLPGPVEWAEFAQAAATMSPGQMLSRLALPESALPAAERLRSQPDLASLSRFVAAAAAGNAMFLAPGIDSRRGAVELLLAGGGLESEMVTAALGALEQDAAALADLTADLSSIARGFLGAYLDARRIAGRPPS